MTWAAQQQQQRSGDLTWAAQQQQQRSGDLTWAAQAAAAALWRPDVGCSAAALWRPDVGCSAAALMWLGVEPPGLKTAWGGAAASLETLLWQTKVRVCFPAAVTSAAGKPPPRPPTRAVNSSCRRFRAGGEDDGLAASTEARGTSELRRRDRAPPNSLSLGCPTLHPFQQQWRGQHLRSADSS
ncbi:hypothetical protein CRENBAI_011336 [Crenichthys baileyi]|uniref:Uncharacterized protein n=1 Tax=Crenichthys baileyi TaxID=28760 RepID=A0AAV9S7C0_9TELE